MSIPNWTERVITLLEGESLDLLWEASPWVEVSRGLRINTVSMTTWPCQDSDLMMMLGLACDTVQSFTLVLPNGTITEVDSKQTDLFFALKGGLNRFGIVTKITFKLVPQVPQVWVSLAKFGPISDDKF